MLKMPSLFSKLDPNKIIDDFTNKDNGHLKNIGEWMDNRSFTPEEQSKANAAAMDRLLSFMSASEPFRMAQRAIAEKIIEAWYFLVINGIACLWINILSDKKTVSMFVEFVSMTFIWLPCSLVFTLYLGGGVINSFKQKPDK